MRIVAIGDVGVVDDMVHIGDEAMFEELVTQTMRRGVQHVTALSSNPAETTARYGVGAILNVGFSPAIAPDRAALTDRLERVVATASGQTGLLPEDDRALAVIDAVRRSDGVAIAGGGNMASIWPMHIFERACLGFLAQHFDKPLVISGQTIGPVLTGDDRDLVARLLSSARLVGLREGASHRLVRELDVPADLTRATIDDASFVGVGPGGGVSDTASAARRPYVLVTLARHLDGLDGEAFAEALAGILDRVARGGDLEIVFLAHFASLLPDDERGDSVIHRRVIDALERTGSGAAWRIEPTTTSAAAADVARNASLVVTSRYHPAVFAVAAGVPTVGIAVDDYTTVKLTGALGNFGQSTVVSARDVIAGAATEIVERAWDARSSTRARWLDLAGERRDASRLWWDDVVAALSR